MPFFVINAYIYLFFSITPLVVLITLLGNKLKHLDFFFHLIISTRQMGCFYLCMSQHSPTFAPQNLVAPAAFSSGKPMLIAGQSMWSLTVHRKCLSE